MERAEVSARDRYIELARAQLGKPVCWGYKGPDAFDCSGLVTWLLRQVGGPDLSHIDNAQALFNGTRALGAGPTDAPLPADLGFYGLTGPTDIEHVVIWLADDLIISADGASSHLPDLAVAKMNPAHSVRTHPGLKYRSDTKFIAVHRFTLLDILDGITR